MDFDIFFGGEFDEHAAVLNETRAALATPFKHLCALGVSTIREGGKIVFFGNGGSAADAQHLATELTIRYINDRAPIAALSLSTDTSALTACGNDLGFDQIFARQIAAVCKPEDLIIGISTSGNSENVLQAFKQAHAMGCKTAALSGKGGGKLTGLVDPLLIVPSQTTSRIQEMHIILGHLLCGALETELGLV
ncbi:MAG: SIS domain-containing protein [Rhodospirillales bacterium]|jgi:D-sedoheptulose 7-phosphate isomerase|nr:SIS domain-containing protein [Rhodospirillales bacterium]